MRTGGTIGWIFASGPHYFVLQGVRGGALERALSNIFLVAGGSPVLLADYSLLLPHTPPRTVAEGAGEKLAWREALRFLRTDPFLLVLFVVTFIDSTIHNG